MRNKKQPHKALALATHNVKPEIDILFSAQPPPGIVRHASSACETS